MSGILVAIETLDAFRRRPVSVAVCLVLDSTIGCLVSLLAARAAEVAQVVPLVKYGIPPLVPATVNARVPLDVIGEPATEIKPPVKDCATLVTVPLVAGAAQVGAPPVVAVRTCPVVPAAVATGVAPAPPP
jgi:hypothetical protein